MGKRSKHPTAKARGRHLEIEKRAQALRDAPRFGLRDAAGLGAVDDLLRAARTAVEQSINAPTSFDFEGRRYWLRVCFGMQLDIFTDPGDARPILRGATFCGKVFGHAPGH